MVQFYKFKIDHIELNATVLINQKRVNYLNIKNETTTYLQKLKFRQKTMTMVNILD